MAEEKRRKKRRKTRIRRAAPDRKVDLTEDPGPADDEPRGEPPPDGEEAPETAAPDEPRTTVRYPRPLR